MSKDNFSSLLKMVSLDDNTKSLIGSSKEEIAKSLRNNINESNSALYNILITKAEEPTKEEEEAFRTALGQDAKDEDVSEIEVREDEGKEPASKFTYQSFKDVYNRMRTLETILPILEQLSEELQFVEKTNDKLFPSGRKYENDEAYDRIRTIQVSNLAISILTELSKKSSYLVDFSDFIKNGILVGILPPKRKSRATGEMIQPKAKENIDVKDIQDRLITLMNREISDYEGGEISFTEALSDLHINRFKKNPLAKRTKGRYSKDIDFAREFVRGTTIGSRERTMQNTLKRLQKIVQSFRELETQKEGLLEKITELEDLADIDVEEVVTQKIQDMNRLLSSGEQVEETFGKYKETLADVRKNPDKYIKEIREKYELLLNDAKIDFRETVNEMKKITSYVEDITTLIEYTKKFLKYPILTDRESKKIRNKLRDANELLEEVRANPNRFGENREQQLEENIESFEEQIQDMEENKEKYKQLRKLIMKNANYLFDIEDEFNRMEKIVDKISESSDKDAERLAGTISEYIIFRGMTGNITQDVARVVSLTEEESENLLSEVGNILEELEKINRINTEIGELL